MSYQRISLPTDINSIIQQLNHSQSFQAKLEEKLNKILENNKQYHNAQSAALSKNDKGADKVIQEISLVIDTLIRNNLQSLVESELRGIKDDIWKLKDELKNQGMSIDYLKRKVEKERGGERERQKERQREKERQPLSFGQPRTDFENQTRNRFQIIRKPANLVVTSGGGSTTYTTLNSLNTPTHHHPYNTKQQSHPSSSTTIPPALSSDITKIKQQLQSLKKQLSIKTLPSSQLIQISNKIDKNNDKIRTQLDVIVKNSDTRFQYTEQSIKKHMERSLESLWKMITSIKNQLEDINSELHLNQSGILT